jgi:hypothetical protein
MSGYEISFVRDEQLGKRESHLNAFPRRTPKELLEMEQPDRPDERDGGSAACRLVIRGAHSITNSSDCNNFYSANLRAPSSRTCPIQRTPHPLLEILIRHWARQVGLRYREKIYPRQLTAAVEGSPTRISQSTPLTASSTAPSCSSVALMTHR